MHRKRIILIASFVLIFTFMSNLIHADVKSWKFEWRFDKMTDQTGCYMYSATQHFSSRAGRVLYSSNVYIAVQSTGRISIISIKELLNPLLKGKIGVRVDSNPPVFGVAINPNGRIATFSKAKSALILEQMRTGQKVLVQVSFFPSSNLIQKEYALVATNPLSYFIKALSSWKGCQYNKQIKHWSGLLLLKTPCNDQCLSHLKKKYDGDLQYMSSVASSNPRMPSGKAGIKEGYVIVAVNGKLISYDDFTKVLENTKSGDKIKIGVYQVYNGKYSSHTFIRP